MASVRVTAATVSAPDAQTGTLASKSYNHGRSVLCVARAIFSHMGPFKCYVMQMGGGVSNFQGNALRRCKVQRYQLYEGVGGGPISVKKALCNT